MAQEVCFWAFLLGDDGRFIWGKILKKYFLCGFLGGVVYLDGPLAFRKGNRDFSTGYTLFCDQIFSPKCLRKVFNVGRNKLVISALGVHRRHIIGRKVYPAPHFRGKLVLFYPILGILG